MNRHLRPQRNGDVIFGRMEVDKPIRWGRWAAGLVIAGAIGYGLMFLGTFFGGR